MEKMFSFVCVDTKFYQFYSFWNTFQVELVLDVSINVVSCNKMRQKQLLITEAYLGPCKTSLIEIIARRVKGS